MKRIRWFGFLSLLAAALAVAAFPQQPAVFTISGTMVAHATNRPLDGVLVIVSPNDHPGQRLTMVTGADGRFLFTNLPAAKYSLMAERRGERQIEAYQGADGYSTGVVTGPGMNSVNLIFPLELPGRISGAVIDEDGEPVRQANILLFRRAVSSGREQTAQAGQVTTGSSGHFHFSHLPAGTYFVAVQAHPWYAQPRTPGTPGAENARDLDVAYPVTYYGDTTNGAEAAPITLAEGGAATVQIALRAVPAIHVPISGVDGQQGAQGIIANVSAEGPGGTSIPATANTAGFNNSYELTGLAPGRYDVQIQSFDRGQSRLISRQTVDLAEGSALSAQGAASISVSGRVIFEGPEHTPKGAGVVLASGNRSFNAAIQEDGTFSFDANPPQPGRYEVYVFNMPGRYVKSVAVKGAALSGDTVEIADGSSVQLSIIAGNGAHSKLDGIVLRDGKPVSAAMVLLVPQDLNRSLIIRRDQSDSDGTFTLREIPPGRYTLLAIDDGSGLAYADPAAIQPYLAGGQVIDMPMRDAGPVKVQVVARKR